MSLLRKLLFFQLDEHRPPVVRDSVWEDEVDGTPTEILDALEWADTDSGKALRERAENLAPSDSALVDA